PHGVVGATRREVGAGHVEDQQLVRGGERYIRRERTLPGRFDPRPATAEIEQQITDAKLRDDLREISRNPTGGWKRNDDALIAGDCACGQGRKIRGSRNSVDRE